MIKLIKLDFSKRTLKIFRLSNLPVCFLFTEKKYDFPIFLQILIK